MEFCNIHLDFPTLHFQNFLYPFISFPKIPPTHKQFQMVVAIISGRANLFNGSNISSKNIMKLIYQHFINIIGHIIGRSMCILNNKFVLLEAGIFLELSPFIFSCRSNSWEVFILEGKRWSKLLSYCLATLEKFW